MPLAVAALDDRETQSVALDYLAALGGPEQSAAVAALARRAPPTDMLAAAARLLSAWSAKRPELERTVAEVHGATGALIRWTVRGPVAGKDAAAIVENHARVPAAEAKPAEWRVVLATAPDWRVAAGPTKGAAADVVWFGHADVDIAEATAVEFQLTGAGTAEVWLNGKSLFRRAEATTNRNAVARFTGELAMGRTAFSSRSVHPERRSSSAWASAARVPPPHMRS